MLTLILTILLTFPLTPPGCATVDATRLANTIYAEARGEATEGQIVGNFYQARRQAAMVAKVPKVEANPVRVGLIEEPVTEDEFGMLWA